MLAILLLATDLLSTYVTNNSFLLGLIRHTRDYLQIQLVDKNSSLPYCHKLKHYFLKVPVQIVFARWLREANQHTWETVLDRKTNYWLALWLLDIYCSLFVFRWIIALLLSNLCSLHWLLLFFKVKLACVSTHIVNELSAIIFRLFFCTYLSVVFLMMPRSCAASFRSYFSWYFDFLMKFCSVCK